MGRRGHSAGIQGLEIDADVDLSWRDAIDANACAFEDGDAGSDDAEGGVGTHGVAWSPASAVGARDGTDHDDASVLLVLGGCVGIVALGCGQFGHGGGRIFQREEGRHAICLEAFL